MFPAFSNALFLAGLAAIAAPILIHLLLRRKSQRMRFSTVQFFVKKDEQSLRKRKLRNLFLLATRVLLFTLIVLAFARPYLPNRASALTAAKRREIVLILDRSASMQAGDASPWRKARDEAHRLIAGLRPDDRVAVIASPGQSAGIPEFLPPQVAEKRVADLNATVAAGQLSDGLKQAVKAISTTRPENERAIYILSDLQRNGSINTGSVPLPRDVPVHVVDLGDRYLPNVSVADLQPEARDGSEAHTRVASYSEEVSTVKVNFSIDGKESSSTSVTVEPGGSTNVPCSIPSLAPGWHSVQARIDTKDGLAADNTSYSVVFVPEPVQTVIVEPRKAEKPFQEESFFLAAALAPKAGTPDEAKSVFSLQKIAPDRFVEALKAGPARKSPELVIVPGLKQLPAGLKESLRSYVTNGGGAILFLGPSVSANVYNTELADLLPARLDRVESTEARESGWRIAEFNRNSPLFAPFKMPNSGNLLLAEFTQRFHLTAPADSSIVAAFDDSAPFIVERKIGRGRVLLVNTTADTIWTDWQKHKTFVPWLHSAGLYLSSRDSRRQKEPTSNFSTGTELDLNVGIKAQTFRVVDPNAKESAFVSDDEGVIRDVTLDQPGVYSIRDGNGHEIRRIAANLPTAESELSFMAPNEFEQQLVRASDPEPTLAASLFAGDPARGKELWRMLLLVALGFLLFEPLLANRTAA